MSNRAGTQKEGTENTSPMKESGAKHAESGPQTQYSGTHKDTRDALNKSVSHYGTFDMLPIVPLQSFANPMMYNPYNEEQMNLMRQRQSGRKGFESHDMMMRYQQSMNISR
jgi:hypothetical protein